MDGWSWKDFSGTQHLWCISGHRSWYFNSILTVQSILLTFFTKLSFILFMVRCFFLPIHFLVAEDYELPKSTSYILIVPLTLESVRILSWSISLLFSTLIVSLMMFFERLLSELMILLSTHRVTKNLTCYSKFR